MAHLTSVRFSSLIRLSFLRQRSEHDLPGQLAAVEVSGGADETDRRSLPARNVAESHSPSNLEVVIN